MASYLSRSRLHVQCEEIICPKLNKLLDVWDEIGITDETLIRRQDVVVGHLSNIVDEMIAEEESHKKSLIARVQGSERDIEKLLQELSISPDESFKIEVSDHCLIKRDKLLRCKLEELIAEKQQRMSTLKELCRLEKQLCDSLGLSTYADDIVLKSVPSYEELNKLSDRITALEAKKMKRKIVFDSTKREILQFMSEMGIEPSTEFEQDLVCEDSDTFKMSSDRMREVSNLLNDIRNRREKMGHEASTLRDQIVAIWNRLRLPEEEREKFDAMSSRVTQQTLNDLQSELDRCRQLLSENLKKMIDVAREELNVLWDRCYVPECKRTALMAQFTEDLTEEDLIRYDQELCRLRSWYEEKRAVYDKVVSWQKCWKDFVDLERLSTDHSRRNNRGGILLRDDLLRKKLLKELPALQKEINDEVSTWNGMEIHIDGKSFSEYTRLQWQEYELHKEQEKIRRQQEKSKALMMEMKFGSRPVEPANKKRMVPTTPTNVSTIPTKLRRMDETHGTPRIPRVLTSTMNISAIPSVKSNALRRRSNRLNASKMGKGSADTTPSSLSSNSNSTSKLPFTPLSLTQSKMTTPFALRQASMAQLILGHTPTTPKRNLTPFNSSRQHPASGLRSNVSKSGGISTPSSHSKSSFKWSLQADKPVFHLLL